VIALANKPGRFRELVFLSALVASTAANAEGKIAAPTPVEFVATVEKCGVVYEDAKGKSTSMVLPSLHVLDLADDAGFSLPADAPAKVTVVQCGRDTIVPQKNDYKVLVAGFPFVIIGDDRVLFLEVVDGQLQVQIKEGQFTEAEIPRLQAFLNEAQPAYSRETPPDKPQ
jgi:hypothetical protein